MKGVVVGCGDIRHWPSTFEPGLGPSPAPPRTKGVYLDPLALPGESPPSEALVDMKFISLWSAQRGRGGEGTQHCARPAQAS